MATFNFRTRNIVWEEKPQPNGQIKHVEKGRIFRNWSIAIYPGNNEIISITRDNETRTYKVTEDHEFCYKVQKTQIKAINGAKGIFDYIDREVTRNTPLYENGIIPECTVNVLQYVWENTKPIKA